MTRIFRRLAERLHIDLFPNTQRSAIKLLRQLADRAENGEVEFRSVSIQRTDASAERKLEAVYLPKEAE